MSDTEPSSRRFVVRAADSRDVPLIHAWLPGAMRITPAAMFAIATEAATGAAAGAALLRVFSDVVGRFRLHVDTPFRRRGCGTALLDWVRETGLRSKATSLLTALSYEAEPKDEAGAVALAFFRARGLSVVQDIYLNRAELAPTLAVLEPLYQRSLQRPDNAVRIVTADQADPRAIAEFAVRHLGGFLEEVTARLRGIGRAYSLPLSMVALVDNRIVGVQLIVAQGETAFVESKSVAADHRGGGWINLALMYRSTAAFAQNGIKTIEFESDRRDRDTIQLARKIGATQVGRRQSWGWSILGSGS